MSMAKLTMALAVLGGAVGLASAQSPSIPALETVKRICIDKFTGDEILAGPTRETIIASVFALRRFAVTENCEKADAILRGAVIEREDRRVRGESESAGLSSLSGAAHGGRAAIAGVGTASEESLYSAETHRQATVIMRITNKDGDVLWAHTQDSLGGKTKGALTDAVDRAVRQLAKDVERASLPAKLER